MNGWSNYETWAVHLWMTSEEGISAALDADAEEAWEANDPEIDECERRYNYPTFSRSDAARYTLADELKEQVEINDPLTEASMYSDLLGSAIQNVNWNEIANSVLASVVEAYESEEAAN